MEHRVARSNSSLTWIIVFIAFGIPAVILRTSGMHLDPLLASLLFGLGIVGGAFLLSWAAEVAQLDVSASFAIAVLALIAILPEYAIESVLAWKAGASFDPAVPVITAEMERVAANVTGANRLLIGLGWSFVILIYFFKRRQNLDLRGFMSLEITFLIVATALTFIIFFTSQVNYILAFVLIAIYVVYLWLSSIRESHEPELVGAAALIGTLSTRNRRIAVLFLFIYSAAIILIAAEPFVEGLVETGTELGIDEFILIQWVAPLASEAPEIIVAVLFSLRANPVAGLSTLISAEVNQLTLLIGSMVVVFSISAGDLHSFPLNERQSVEFLLTSAVSLYAIMLIAPRVIGWKGGAMLLGLFIAHLFFTDTQERLWFTYIYLGVTVLMVLIEPRRVTYVFRAAIEGGTGVR